MSTKGDGSSAVNAITAGFCYLDFDLDQHRARWATTAAFCQACDARYGLSSNDLRHLGGAELQRVPDFMKHDHEWSGRLIGGSAVVTRPPAAGCRVVVQLYWDVAPLACENFAKLCHNALLMGVNKCPVGDSGKPLTYKDCVVHRIVPGFVLQSGDFVFGNGSGGECVFGNKRCFKDEKAGLALNHDHRGVISMGNSGKNSNASQFFITLGDKLPQCDGKHVVFGRVVSGWPVLDACEALGTPHEGVPTTPVTITDCGLWTPLRMPGAGVWYDQPDSDSFAGVSPRFLARPRVMVIAPLANVAERFAQMLTKGCEVHTVLVNENDESQDGACLQDIHDRLGRFAVDVVLVAPACRERIATRTKVPSTWALDGSTFPRNNVVHVAKPMDALQAVYSEPSWLARFHGWNWDGR